MITLTYLNINICWAIKKKTASDQQNFQTVITTSKVFCKVQRTNSFLSEKKKKVSVVTDKIEPEVEAQNQKPTSGQEDPDQLQVFCEIDDDEEVASFGNTGKESPDSK